MSRVSQIGVVLVLFAVLLQAGPSAKVDAAAGDVHLPTDVAAIADVIVDATVESDVVIEFDKVPHTVVMLSVHADLKGESEQPAVPVLVPGGLTADGRNVFVTHAARFRIGQQVQVGLVPSQQAGLEEALLAQGVISSPLFEVAAGDRGVVHRAPGGLEAHAAGASDFVITPGTRWASFSRPAQYLVNVRGSGVPAAATRAAVHRAAHAWEGDPGSVVDFAYAGSTSKRGFDPGDGENVISFQHLPAHAFVGYTTWFSNPDGTIEFDTVLNTRYAFSDGAVPGHYDVQMVVTHELGHALGLAHPAQPGASQEIMSATVLMGVAPSLGDGDRAGVRFLYPAPFLPLPPASCSDLGVTVDLNTGVGTPTAGDDVILGTPGPDWIWALGGNDTICGGGGVDRIFAGSGNDQVFGQGGSDQIWGGAGDDAIYGGSGADRVWAGDGNDAVYGQGGQDLLLGQGGNDQLQGNWQSDELRGGVGNDVLRGAGGKDALYGGAGNDSLYGGLNTDYLHGGGGVDVGDGQQGKDNPLLPGVSGCEQIESLSSC